MRAARAVPARVERDAFRSFAEMGDAIRRAQHRADVEMARNLQRSRGLASARRVSR